MSKQAKKTDHDAVAYYCRSHGCGRSFGGPCGPTSNESLAPPSGVTGSRPGPGYLLSLEESWPPLAGALRFPTFVRTMGFYDCSRSILVVRSTGLGLTRSTTFACQSKSPGPFAFLTSLYMCSVPKRPSPPPPFQRQTKHTFSTPHARVV